MQTQVTSRQIALPPLRAVRQARGLGLRQVAREARIDSAHLSRVERGERTLSVAALLRLARVLELRELVKLLEPYVPERIDAPGISEGAVQESAEGGDGYGSG
jgi:transcriptional regulator with XRE-family HTH domain